MIQTVKVKDLQIGMYVILPKGFLNWVKHTFIRNQFLIENESQLQSLQKSRFQEVQVDTARSKLEQEITTLTHPPFEPEIPAEWHPDKNFSESLKQAINDPALSPQERAERIHQESIELMKTLLQHPSAEMIAESKKAIGHIVDVILTDDDTTYNLLKITSHDFYTYTHSVNVGILAIALAKRLYALSPEHNMRELGAGFFLHDLGKVYIKPEILNKPGKLTEEEMKKMRTHPSYSYAILKNTSQLTRECAIITLQHHERVDGSGYPMHLQGEEIHDYARICCIADVFDALTAERSYKKAVPTFKALQIMKEEMLGHFDREIFGNFVVMFSKDRIP